MRKPASIALVLTAAAACEDAPPNATYDLAERSAEIDPSRDDRIVVSLSASWGSDARRSAQITYCSIHFWVESDQEPPSRDLVVRAESGADDVAEGPISQGIVSSSWEAEIPGTWTEDRCDASAEITFSGPEREQEGYPVRFGGFGFVRFPSGRDAADLRGSISLSGP